MRNIIVINLYFYFVVVEIFYLFFQFVYFQFILFILQKIIIFVERLQKNEIFNFIIIDL